MTTPDNIHIKELFGEIIDAREQHRYDDAKRILEDIPADLRKQVCLLLDAHERASGALLDDPILQKNGSTPLVNSTPIPTIIGYEISEEIGHGGFGIVYRAIQHTPIHRPVAIKVLRRELVSDDAITRFRAESALLARMNHDSIARVFDAGLTEQGQPFVSMQLIDAEPLHHACKTLELGTSQRIELIAQICDAIQHAHQRAVIHRDLKPANILVEHTSEGIIPRVIDFGIAKLLEDDPNSPHTRASVRLGTPRYMSPEQRTGTVSGDTRIDVYALGAILCELLAGDVPTGHTQSNKETDPSVTRPSKIASEQTHPTITPPKTLRGDLDRIVLKACADDPELRYPSAQAMGDDLRRYLDGLPISASPPGVVYIARKFIRRHRASVSLAAVLSIALLFTMGIAGLKWREARIERDKAIASTNRVAFIGDFFLEMLLLSADHNTRGAPPILTESEMQDIADRAKEGLNDDPDHMLPILVGIGRFQTQAGYAQQGTQTLREALDFAINHYGSPSPEVVNLRIHLHDLLWGHGLEGAREQIAQADQESASIFDDHDPRRLRVRQRADDSIENLTQILELYERISDIDPFDRYQALFALNMKHRFSQHPERQVEITQKLYQVTQAHYPPDHSATIDAMALYGDALSVFDPSQEAIDLLQTAYDMAVPKYGYDHFTTESIRRGLARVFGKLGRAAEGIPYALADVESAKRSQGPTSFQYANALYELGRLYQYTEQHKEALDAISLALDLRKNQWPKGHVQIVVAQVALAQLQYEIGAYDHALALIDEIFEYIQDLRSARTYAAVNSVRISIALQRNDEATAESLRQSTLDHMIGLGLSQERIEQLLQ